MELNGYIEEIKLKLTGGVLELELGDSELAQIVNSAFREVQRYINTTKLITIPFENCIDMTKYKCSAVTHVYRAKSYNNTSSDNTSTIDPVYASQWLVMGGPSMVGTFQNYALNYAAYNTLMQVRNTLSTDLDNYYDKSGEKLYINIGNDRPDSITIEYVPRYDNPEEITSDYWIDVLMRMSVALAKVVVGNIRSRFTQSNALWAQDGEAMRSEGNAELEALREMLRTNAQLTYPKD